MTEAQRIAGVVIEAISKTVIADMADQIDERFKNNAMTFATIAAILVEKGVCTEEEFKTALTRNSAMIDQYLAKKRDTEDQPPEPAGGGR